MPTKALVIALFVGAGAVAAAHRVRTGLHTWLQVSVGGSIGAAFAVAWQLYAQPALTRSTTLSGPAVAGLMVVGALTVGSVERLVGARLKRRRAE